MSDVLMDPSHDPKALRDCLDRLDRGAAQLERLLDEILASPERPNVLPMWMPLAAILGSHLDLERRALPLELSARDQHALVAEHRHLRTRLEELDRAFDTGALDLGAVRSFAVEVRAQQRRERALLRELWLDRDAGTDDHTERVA